MLLPKSSIHICEYYERILLSNYLNEQRGQSGLKSNALTGFVITTEITNGKHDYIVWIINSNYIKFSAQHRPKMVGLAKNKKL